MREKTRREQEENKRRTGGEQEKNRRGPGGEQDENRKGDRRRIRGYFIKIYFLTIVR